MFYHAVHIFSRALSQKCQFSSVCTNVLHKRGVCGAVHAILWLRQKGHVLVPSFGFQIIFAKNFFHMFFFSFLKFHMIIFQTSPFISYFIRTISLQLSIMLLSTITRKTDSVYHICHAFCTFVNVILYNRTWHASYKGMKWKNCIFRCAKAQLKKQINNYD